MEEARIGSILPFGDYNWRVLAVKEQSILLMTEEIIEQREYHDTPEDITWADCALRKYLNDAFYNSFTEADKVRIIPTSNKNSNNEWYDSIGGEDTQDHIFLLSIEETVCQYFGDSSKLLYNPSKKQRYWFQRKDENNPKREAYFNNRGWWWWLRSPGRGNRRAVYIHGDGNIGIQGNGTFKYSSNTLHPISGDNRGGVRPALWLKLES
ncbi:hypothetical protein I6N96_13700 [Enterococcus sp. BWM-S5]|uniref:DUF6273 domain-containing protein n=1 Tax=Enterococcus larvae TaxID=2794352 RepID=A0ABS4CMC2_9ENTE|nr:hypothetical protein [Enterococcus larvae]